MHSVGCGAHQFFGVFKGEAARQGERQIGKISCARATHTCLLHSQHSGHLLHFVNDLLPGFGRNLVHQHADGFARQAQGDAQNHERDHDGGNRVGVAQPWNVGMQCPSRRRPTQRDTASVAQISDAK